MKTRAAKFLVALVASVASSASLVAAPDSAQQAADTCLTSPGEKTPAGGHWRYRIERGTGRHCWYVKGASEKTARTAPADATEAAEEPAPAPARKKAAAPRSVSEAHAEFAQPAPEPAASPAPAPAPVPEGSQRSSAKDANMLAPSIATRWPDSMSTVNSPTAPAAPAAAAPQPAPVERAAEAPAAPAAAPAPPPQVMPRAVPPVPVSEQPMSLPMLITVVAGGLSVVAVLLSMFFGWRASREPRLTESAPMPPLEYPEPEQARRPGDLYRERKLREASGRRAA